MRCRCYPPPPVSLLLGRSLVVALFAVLALPSVGCRGWRNAGDTFYGHRVPKKRARRETTYSFGQPGGQWRPLRDVDDVQVAWIRREIVGVIELHAQCDEQGDSNLYQYTDHLRIDWTDWQVESQSERTLVGRAALRTIATGRLDGVQMKLEMWVVKRAGCLFDLHYAAPPDTFAQGQSQFADVVAGFQFPV